MIYEERIEVAQIVSEYKKIHGGDYSDMLEKAKAAIKNDGPKVLANHMPGSPPETFSNGAMADGLKFGISADGLTILVQSENIVLFSIRKGLVEVIEQACKPAKK